MPGQTGRSHEALLGFGTALPDQHPLIEATLIQRLTIGSEAPSGAGSTPTGCISPVIAESRLDPDGSTGAPGRG